MRINVSYIPDGVIKITKKWYVILLCDLYFFLKTTWYILKPFGILGCFLYEIPLLLFFVFILLHLLLSFIDWMKLMILMNYENTTFLETFKAISLVIILCYIVILYYERKSIVEFLNTIFSGNLKDLKIEILYELAFLTL